MTLDEAIERYTSNAEYERTHGNLQGCLEFRQLAEWLRDYKRLKEQEPCEDAISRQNDILPNIDKKVESYGKLLKHPVVKRIMGIDKEPSENAISRQAVDTLVDELARAISDERCCISRGRSTATIMQDILDLPSVKPQTGHWRHYEGMLTCSECGAEFYDDIMEYCGDDAPKCCPDCGARMEVEQNG